MQRRQGRIGGHSPIVLSVKNQSLESPHPFICLNLRVGYQFVSDPRNENLKCLLLIGHSLHLNDVMNIDESFQ